MKRQISIIIPARFGSSRFPGKPLAMIAGLSLLERVYRIASAVPDIDRVAVATDDPKIVDHVKGFGGNAVMTPLDCRNGSERVFKAMQDLVKDSSDIIINFQGDAVLTPPWIINDVIQAMVEDPSIKIATPAVRLSYANLEKLELYHQNGNAGGTTVTFDTKGDALYFTKGIIPFVRGTRSGADSPVFKHIGLYGYTASSLAQYVALAPARFEEVEQLEQLRALENGIAIRVVQVDLKGRTMWSIDNPIDVTETEKIITTQGELFT